MAPELGRAAVDAVEGFAVQMGLTAEPAEDGSFGFVFEESGRLSILSDGEGNVLVSLTRRLIASDGIGLGAVLAIGGHNPAADMTVHPGLTRAGAPVLLVALPERGFDLPRLDGAFALLAGLYREAGL